MKILVTLDIDTPDLHTKANRDWSAEEAAEAVQDTKQNILDGITSVDVQDAIASCLATYYVSVLDEDVKVNALDATELEPLTDKRRRFTHFKVRNGGGITQVSA